VNKKITIKEYIETILKTINFAVLATEGNGQPHVSLVAITPIGDCRQLVFATYRNTLKYRNLESNGKVAVLIESRVVDENDPGKRIVLTIIGNAEEISITKNEAVYRAHLKRHPEMESFMLSSDCALILVTAQSFQVVNGIDEIRWVTADELDSI
jgi:nitroimidazol reductase NimA-like FMN-containing flavoprotein (pyridoxamine 5'-phosphate oxidase superfamily)